MGFDNLCCNADSMQNVKTLTPYKRWCGTSSQPQKLNKMSPETPESFAENGLLGWQYILPFDVKPMYMMVSCQLLII